MEDGNSLIGIFILIGLIMLDAVFYGFGAAIQNLNSSQLEREDEEGNKWAVHFMRVMENPSKFIYTVQVAANIVGMITGAFVLGSVTAQLQALFLSGQLEDRPWISIASLCVAAVLLLLCIISFGIVIPKKCAARNPLKWANRTFPIVSVCTVPLLPFTWAVMGISFVVLKVMGIDLHATEDDVTEEEIMSMVNEGHEKGVLEASEAEMITNIFELADKNAGDIMTHRTNLVAIDGDLTLAEAVSFILQEANNSRFPVYQKDIDDIVGVLHMRDALTYADNRQYENTPVREIPGLLREPHFIPETRNLDTLFKEMQSQKIHMEVVVDEYGQTAGIVTMEDILEEIVGNILDEYDEDEEFISKREDGSYLIDGMTPLEDVEKALDFEFEEADFETYDTVNGFMISRLDRIPQPGEELEVSHGGYLFKVLSVENKMIHTVLVTLIEEQHDNSESTEQMEERAVSEA